MYTQYEHHGQTVTVRSDLQGKHRHHCLCFDGCKHFAPGTEQNCEIAAAVYRNCVQFNIVTPVWECPRFTR
jgi:hypothetical protein